MKRQGEFFKIDGWILLAIFAKRARHDVIKRAIATAINLDPVCPMSAKIVKGELHIIQYSSFAKSDFDIDINFHKEAKQRLDSAESKRQRKRDKRLKNQENQISVLSS